MVEITVGGGDGLGPPIGVSIYQARIQLSSQTTDSGPHLSNERENQRMSERILRQRSRVIYEAVLIAQI